MTLHGNTLEVKTLFLSSEINFILGYITQLLEIDTRTSGDGMGILRRWRRFFLEINFTSDNITQIMETVARKSGDL